MFKKNLKGLVSIKKSVLKFLKHKGDFNTEFINKADEMFTG